MRPVSALSHLRKALSPQNDLRQLDGTAIDVLIGDFSNFSIANNCNVEAVVKSRYSFKSFT